MSYKELIDALYKECEEKIRSIRDESEAEAGRIQADSELIIERLGKEHKLSKAAAIRDHAETILREAEKRAMAVRLLAEKGLTERLYQSAHSALNSLRDCGYAEIFGGLVKELPDYSWGKARVNPVDMEIARQYFPDAEIVSDNGITGGFEVISGDGGIRISNTFDKRLEQAWEDILPCLVRDIRGV